MFPSTQYEAKGTAGESKISPIDAAPNVCGEVMTNECFNDVQTTVKKDVEKIVGHNAQASEFTAQLSTITNPCEYVLKDGFPKSCKSLEQRIRSRIQGSKSTILQRLFEPLLKG